MSDLILTGDDIHKVKDLSFDMTMMATAVGNALGAAYPWFAWHVSFTTGVIQVNLNEIRSVWGFNINTTGIASSSELRAKAITLGGELLERFNLSRSRAGAQQLRDAFHDRRILIPQL